MNKSNVRYLFCVASLGWTTQLSAKPWVSESHYGYLTNGQAISQYTLSAGDLQLKVINYGAIITELFHPDKNGYSENLVLGYDYLAAYEQHNRFFGTIVGRYANRIANANFDLNGEQITLSKNKGEHHIHGGFKGLDKVIWLAETNATATSANITLSYFSPDGEEGYPANVKFKLIYSITTDNTLTLEYSGQADAPTIINLTQHSYFNLAPQQTSIKNHMFKTNAAHYLPIAQSGLPTGKVQSVIGTPFDFKQAELLQTVLTAQNKQITLAKGLDHYFLFKDKKAINDKRLVHHATLFSPESGRSVKVLSTEQGFQLYSANYLNPTVVGKGGQPYQAQQGICIETGALPNAPAEANFPFNQYSETKDYFAKTVFEFSNNQ